MEIPAVAILSWACIARNVIDKFTNNSEEVEKKMDQEEKEYNDLALLIGLAFCVHLLIFADLEELAWFLVIPLAGLPISKWFFETVHTLLEK